jgi:hypothetical protein
MATGIPSFSNTLPDVLGDFGLVAARIGSVESENGLIVDK